MKKALFFTYISLPLLLVAQKYPTPDQLYGQLFIDVQMQQVFADGKLFLDCTPKRKVADIMYEYGMIKGVKLNLKKFVENNFELPPPSPAVQYIQRENNIGQHMQNQWSILQRDADISPGWESKDANGQSLLALPFPYVLPGNSYREVHYWDSYFTLLGLKAAGQYTLLENMVKNFDYLIYQFGHVPQGNRTYYLSRSQPPFFCLMVELLASVKGSNVYKKHLPSMLKEYAYWMQGADSMQNGESSKHIVKMPDGSILNRYWDENNSARPENYRVDTETADTAALQLAMQIKVASEEKLNELLDYKRKDTYRHLRAAAESGWDGSSRWLHNGDRLSGIQTTDIIPVDLNCLLYSMEKNIAKALQLSGKLSASKLYSKKAGNRKAAINRYCWNNAKGYYFDFNVKMQQQSDIISAAGMYPIFVKMATPVQAKAMAASVAASLLKPGGIVATTNSTSLPWDAPYGWPSLQWIAVTGFKNYKQKKLSQTIAQRWIHLIEHVFISTGKILDKYNVEEISNQAQSGYSTDDVFGCTNGVYMAVKKINWQYQ